MDGMAVNVQSMVLLSTQLEKQDARDEKKRAEKEKKGCKTFAEKETDKKLLKPQRWRRLIFLWFDGSFVNFVIRGRKWYNCCFF